MMIFCKKFFVAPVIFLVSCANTDFGGHNGSPPSLEKNGSSQSINDLDQQRKSNDVIESPSASGGDGGTSRGAKKNDGENDFDSRPGPATNSETEQTEVTSDDEPVKTPRPAVIATSEQLIRSCSDPATVTEKRQSLLFPSRQGCPFGQADNLDEDDGTITARVTQEQPLELPKNSVLCSLDLQTPPAAMVQYDDFMYLRLNDYVLAGDSGFYVSRLEREGPAYVWAWENVRGMSHEPDVPTYCFGGTQCTLPGHDEEGPVDIAVPQKKLAELAIKLHASGVKPTVKLTLLGDNESGDCWHTGITLEATIRYVLAK